MSASAVRFRIYPAEPRNGLYAMIHVWPTRKAMLRKGGYSECRRTEAFCSPLEIISYATGKARKSGLFAEVHFYRDNLTMRIVTHEIFHATMAYGRRIKFDWQRLGADDSINSSEERLTYAHCHMCRDFMEQAIRLGLYRTAKVEKQAAVLKSVAPVLSF